MPACVSLIVKKTWVEIVGYEHVFFKPIHAWASA